MLGKTVSPIIWCWCSWVRSDDVNLDVDLVRSLWFAFSCRGARKHIKWFVSSLFWTQDTIDKFLYRSMPVMAMLLFLNEPISLNLQFNQEILVQQLGIELLSVLFCLPLTSTFRIDSVGVWYNGLGSKRDFIISSYMQSLCSSLPSYCPAQRPLSCCQQFLLYFCTYLSH